MKSTQEPTYLATMKKYKNMIAVSKYEVTLQFSEADMLSQKVLGKIGLTQCEVSHDT